MKLIKVISGKGKNLHLSTLIYKNSDGKIKPYSVVSRRRIKRRSDLKGWLSGVMAVITNENGDILLTKEFRLGVNQWLIGLPSGMVEKHETTEACAAREVEEETKITEVIIDQVSKPLFLNPTMSNEMVSIAYGHIGSSQVPGGSNDANEEITAFWLPKAELKDYMAKHTDHISLVVWLILQTLL